MNIELVPLKNSHHQPSVPVTAHYSSFQNDAVINARYYFAKGDTTNAINYLKSLLINHQNTDAKALFIAGNLLQTQSGVDKAIKTNLSIELFELSLEKGLSFHYFEDSYAKLGMLYVRLAKLSNSSANCYRKAAKYYQKALAYHPDNTQYLLLLSNIYAKQSFPNVKEAVEFSFALAKKKEYRETGIYILSHRIQRQTLLTSPYTESLTITTAKGYHHLTNDTKKQIAETLYQFLKSHPNNHHKVKLALAILAHDIDLDDQVQQYCLDLGFHPDKMLKLIDLNHREKCLELELQV